MRRTGFLDWSFLTRKQCLLFRSDHTATARHGCFSFSPGFIGDYPFGTPFQPAFVRLGVGPFVTALFIAVLSPPHQGACIK
jgi:hypothetical protein